MNALQEFEEIKEAAEIENEAITAPIELSPDIRGAISDASKHKRLIIAILKFSKRFFGSKVDAGIDKAILLIEMIL